MRGLAAALALLLISLVGLRAATAVAGDPAVLTCKVDDVVPVAEAHIKVDCVVVDTEGAPVPEAPLTFFINFQVRTDASLDNGRTALVRSTDARGQAQAAVDVGSTPGTLGILVNYPGIFSSYTFVQVVAPPPLLPEPGPAPEEPYIEEVVGGEAVG